MCNAGKQCSYVLRGTAEGQSWERVPRGTKFTKLIPIRKLGLRIPLSPLLRKKSALQHWIQGRSPFIRSTLLIGYSVKPPETEFVALTCCRSTSLFTN